MLFYMLVPGWLLHSQVQLCPEAEKENPCPVTEEAFPRRPFSCLIGQIRLCVHPETDKGHRTAIINLDQSR